MWEYCFCPVCQLSTLTLAITFELLSLHIWNIYSSNDALSNDTKVNDLMTLTLAFLLKITTVESIILVCLKFRGFQISDKLVGI